jgi:2-keto-3-deoxy-L-fuconate dehydrogenase
MTTPSPDAEFGGLVAVVTGAASGIGAEVASMLSQRGATVAGLDLHADQVAPPVQGIACDVRDDATVQAAVDEVVARYGRLDVVVNCAGIGAQGTVETATDEQWQTVLDVNVIGTARVSRAALPHLRRSPSAAIVNIASIVATAGLPQRAVYSASKGAILSLTLAMAADHLHEGVRVSCVNPGTADTPWVSRLLSSAADPVAERAALEARQPNGRLVSAAEVAHAVVYLASPLAGATTGTSLAVDGGLSGLRLRPRSVQ